MAEAPAALVGMNHLLNVIRFEGVNDRDNIMEAGLAQFEDFRYLVEKDDIQDMADEFGKRTTQANGRIIFGLGRTKKLVGVMLWVQDSYRASHIPNHEHFDEDALFEALSMAQIRKSDMELVATNSKASDPGKFKDKRVSRIPLSYIVREQDEPTPRMEYSTFNEQMVHRALLTGQYYIADARRVHSLLVGFLQGKNTENWIRNIARYQDGRRDMVALRRHYAGECNSTRRIADAKRIQNLLHYKTGRVLPFNKFLDSLQHMFTIVEEENEPLTERAKVDELLTKVQNTSLAAGAVAQLRYQLNTEGFISPLLQTI